MRKKLATVTAHGEVTVSSRWPKWSQSAVTEPWPGPWLSCDLAVIILKMPWLSCDLTVTELWPRRDWAKTSPSRDWAVIIWPGAVTTVVTVSSRRQFFSHGLIGHGTNIWLPQSQCSNPEVYWWIIHAAQKYHVTKTINSLRLHVNMH